MVVGAGGVAGMTRVLGPAFRPGGRRSLGGGQSRRRGVWGRRQVLGDWAYLSRAGAGEVRWWGARAGGHSCPGERCAWPGF